MKVKRQTVSEFLSNGGTINRIKEVSKPRRQTMKVSAKNPNCRRSIGECCKTYED